jgi:pyrimidine operon attenuation protein/uracil phosphoribosyltransferase
MRKLLDAADAERGLKRLAGEILERNRGVEKLLLVGIRRGGEPLAKRLAELLSADGAEVPVGTVDISLYRDDVGTALPNPRIGPTRLPVSIEGFRIILCDDVLYTGRTVRAAVDALLDYGRPSVVQLAVLLERRGRELPIQADYFVRSVDVAPQERVDVTVDQGHFSATAVPVGSPTIPPPPVEARQEHSQEKREIKG